MAKLKQYEINAIVETIVSKIDAANAAKKPSPHLSNYINEANKALKKSWELKKKAEKEYEDLYDKTQKSLSSTCQNNHSWNCLPKFVFVGTRNTYNRHTLRTEITMSSITDKSIKSVIEKLVEKYTK